MIVYWPTVCMWLMVDTVDGQVSSAHMFNYVSCRLNYDSPSSVNCCHAVTNYFWSVWLINDFLNTTIYYLYDSLQFQFYAKEIYVEKCIGPYAFYSFCWYYLQMILKIVNTTIILTNFNVYH